MHSRLIILAVLLVTATGVRANVSLPDVIGDGMVLQQKQRVPIWGEADPGEAITVRFAGQSKKTTASADGKWLVKLDPLVYNGMIAPLIPFSLRGAIWYQGESNEARAQQYELLLPTMIRAWRERWGQGNFPFGIVQLPNYRDQKPEPADEPWGHLREAQRRTAMNTANTGLIVTIDIGEARDIHPKNKLDVGKRMTRWALVDVYGRKLTKSGPVFREAKIAGAKIIVKFDEAGAGLKIRDGDKLDEFAIAGADHKWHWANARIVGKNTIEVWSEAVSQPLAVRYAFNNNPRHPNLTNETGLPAAPFRTDNWPGPTDGKK